MNVEEARDFVREHKRAVLATMRSNGTPQMSPVAVEVDDDGLIIISTRETDFPARPPVGTTYMVTLPCRRPYALRHTLQTPARGGTSDWGPSPVAVV